MLVADILKDEPPTTSSASAMRIPSSEATVRSLDLSVLPIDSELARTDWMAMFHATPAANPFQHPDYVLAELEHSPTSARFPSVVLRVGSVTQCSAVGVLVPKTVRTSQVGGIGPGWSTHGFRLVGGSFLTADQSAELQSKLLEAAVQHCAKSGAGFLLIEDLDEQSALTQAVHATAANQFRLFDARESQPRWRIELPGNAEDYWKTFSGRTRRAFRTRLKKFGQSRLERVSDLEQVPAFLSAAYDVSKQSWQSRQFGLRIRNDQSELQRLSVLAQQGFLRSYLWVVEGQPAAFALCHQHANYFRYEEIAYCAQYSPLSPGETMLQQIIEDLYQHDTPQWFDFGGGDAEYKRRFGNQESFSHTLWLVPSTWRGSAMLGYLNGCRGMRSVVRSTARICGLATKARQWLRYGGRTAHARPVVDEASNNTGDADTSTKIER